MTDFRSRPVSHFRVLSAALTLLLSFATPVASSAATIQSAGSASSVSAQTSTVTAGEFLRTVMKAMDYNLMEDKKKLPFRRIPKGLEPYVQTAYAFGALGSFGRDFAPARPITRGQAAQVLTTLEGLQRTKPKDVSFTDVHPNGFMARAVGIAIEQGWLTPNSDKEFGVSDKLTQGEFAAIVKAVSVDHGDAKDVPTISIDLSKEQTKDGAVLSAVQELLKRDYLYKDRLTNGTGQKTVDGLVKSLNDPYTTYMPPASATNYDQQLSGNIVGIGAQVEQVDGVLTIVAPIPGSPAEKAGLQAGDQILKVNDVSLAGMTLDEAVSKVRGEKGSQAKLRIKRDGVESDVTIVRDSIKTLEIQTSMDGNIAVVKLLQFGNTADADLRAVFKKVADASPQGVIIDLRNNPGGLLHAAEILVSNFLSKGSAYITMQLNDGKTEIDVTHDEPTVAANVPLVVLVNKGSASAAEVAAGALQEAGRAKVVGERSYGKGTVQEIWKFNDGSSLKMTIAEWKTPKGAKINGVGIMPDYEVTRGSNGDTQLDKALDLIRKM